MPGFAESGDGHLVKPIPSGILVAVVDGLGHGSQAAAATQVALTTLETYAHQPLIPLLEQCHADLRNTRGVVMSLASFHAAEGTMTWLGVGNVRGTLLRTDADAASRRETLITRGGVVGYRIPSPRTSTIAVAPGDTLIFVTDGIRSGFFEGLSPLGGPLPTWTQDPAETMVERILSRYGTGTDDTLVLVARYIGSQKKPKAMMA